MFPAPGGTFRSSRRFLLGKRSGVERWPLILAAAGLADASPPIVWHSFRHTCATSLLSGLWGQKWQPDEVQRHLGHESLDTTLGYARLVDERMSELAAATSGARSREVHGVQQLAEIARQSSMGAKKCCFSDVSEWIREVAPLGDHAVIAIARGSMDGVEALLAMGWHHPLIAALLAATEPGPHQPARVLEFVRLVHRMHGADASRGVGT